MTAHNQFLIKKASDEATLQAVLRVGDGGFLLRQLVEALEETDKALTALTEEYEN